MYATPYYEPPLHNAYVPFDEAFEEEDEEDFKKWFPDCGTEWNYEEEHFLNEGENISIAKDDNIRVRPSQFTEYAFRMPAADGIGYEKFSFEGRRHLYRPYDSPARRILMVCGRQVEKSTLLGNITIAYMSLIPSFKVLYVSPSATQTKTFSADRLKDPLETSPVLRKFTTTMLSKNILEKQFVNRSKVTLRYAFLNADRTRGIPAWMLMLDEIQDIMSDNIPVIEQCTSHAPERWKRFFYSGTPKSLDNVIEYYRSRHSTQGEWVVPCDCKGGEGGRFWNILGERSIGKKGPICTNCGKVINPQHDDAQWAFMVDDAPFESYRIPQLMVPWMPWEDILLNYKRYPRDKFYNEVLGISFDSGLRPLTQAQVRACCNDSISMDDITKYEKLSINQPVFMGIDWGTGENSYTVVTLATYVDGKFRVFFAHRFIGEEVDPPVQMAIIKELVNRFNVHLIGTDYGGGFHPNDDMVRAFGPRRVWKYQYLPRPKAKVEWDNRMHRFKLHRTECMSDIFNAIKRGNVFEFPRWEEFNEPYGQDMLNIFSEYNNQLRMIQYKHSPDNPDDTLHSLVYCFLASMLWKPRTDVIKPTKEVNGVPEVDWPGPIDQHVM